MGPGTDTDSSDNIINTGAGNDTPDGRAGRLIGGAGSDSILGGTGSGTADHSALGSGAAVNPMAGIGSCCDGVGDTPTGVGTLTGRAYAGTSIAIHGVPR